MREAPLKVLLKSKMENVSELSVYLFFYLYLVVGYLGKK